MHTDYRNILQEVFRGVSLPQSLEKDISYLLTIALKTISHRFGPELVDAFAGILAASGESTDILHHNLEQAEDLIGPLSFEEKGRLISLYNIIFHLLNAAEKLNIANVNREREKHGTKTYSLEKAVGSYPDAGEIEDALSKIRILPTITAHPTEARRLTVLHKLDEIAKLLAASNDPGLSEHESRKIQDKIARAVLLLSATSSIRETKPDVIQEVRFALHYLGKTIWQVIPVLYSDLSRSITRHFGGEGDVPVILRFRSWIGGDRDGNPLVTGDVTRETLDLLRLEVMKLHREELARLRRDISISGEKAPVSPALLKSIEKDQKALNHFQIAKYITGEYFRIKLDLMLIKMDRAVSDPTAYSDTELLADLEVIRESLIETGFREITRGSTLERTILRVKTFGFHFAALDIRQHSAVHARAVSELLRSAGIAADYESLSEQEKTGELQKLLADEKICPVPDSGLSGETQELLGVLRLIKSVQQSRPGALGAYIVSMTHSPSDMLEVLFLMKLTGLCSRNGPNLHTLIDLVPLFETVEDLENCDALLGSILANTFYRSHLDSRGGFQEIMLGYSDSNKDGGFLSSNVLLHRSHEKLARAAEAYGVKIGFFHGRGGTIARGGGRTCRAIQATGAVHDQGYIRFTEQGEVISFRYGLPVIAHRHLEQIVNAMLTKPPADFCAGNERAVELLEAVTADSIKAYRDLVHHPLFWEWYVKTTPIEFISKLPIASRPVSRNASQVNFEQLRAIPWGFAWNQSRFMVPGWFGMGTALSKSDPAALHSLYAESDFFRMIIDGVELELARARPPVGARYARDSRPEITSIVRAEYDLTLQMIMQIKQTSVLLLSKPLIRSLIILRNRPLDAVHIIQRRIMEEIRTAGAEDPALQNSREKVILESINTISAALQTTG